MNNRQQPCDPLDSDEKAYLLYLKEEKKEIDESKTFTLSQFCRWQNLAEVEHILEEALKCGNLYKQIYCKYKDWDWMISFADTILDSVCFRKVK